MSCSTRITGTAPVSSRYSASLRVLELDEIHPVLEAQGPNQIGHGGIAVFRDLLRDGWDRCVFRPHPPRRPRGKPRAVVVADRLVGFAKTGQDEIDAARQRAAEIIDSYRAAMRKRKRQIRGNNQHARFAAECPHMRRRPSHIAPEARGPRRVQARRGAGESVSRRASSASSSAMAGSSVTLPS